MSSSPRNDWLRDSESLVALGKALDEQPMELEVRLPRRLVMEAIAAWERDEVTDADLTEETVEDRRIRQRAGALGLIGLELSNQDLPEGDPVQVHMRANLIGDALRAAWGDD